MEKRPYFLIFLLISAIFIGGCSLPWSKKTSVDISVDSLASIDSGNNGAASAQMKKFTDYRELQTFLETNAVEEGVYFKDMIAGESSSAGDVESAGSFSGYYSSANIQAEGVDRADIIKTDGQYIYAVVYQDLYIIKASPAEQAKAVAKISFNSRPSDIHLDNNRLVVIGADRQLMQTGVYQNFRRQSPYTFVKIFDLSDPESPKQIRDLDFEGSYRDSRVVGGRLYLIIDNYSVYVRGESIVPRLVDGGKILSSDCSQNGRCFAPDVYYFDLPYDKYYFHSVNSLDLHADEAPVEAQTYILNGAQHIYVSARNIFITYADHSAEFDLRLKILKSVLESKLSSSEQAKLAKIDSVDSDVLGASEKKRKLFQFFENFLDSRSADEFSSLSAEIEAAFKKAYADEADNREHTLVYKLSLSGGKPVYRASASVFGEILGQSALDEDVNGNLRLVTESKRSFGDLSGNRDFDANVYVLSSDLKPLGQIEGLAPGEKIRAVRFLGTRAYLDTLKQSGHLLALDLSDSKAPKLLGEIKIPGFSAYFYPYNEKTLIVLGRNTETDVYGNVRAGGLKLSLFDVGDVANARELDSYVAGSVGSDSLALYDDKAFLFDSGKNLLAIPASLTASASGNQVYFSGALVFGVENGKFSLKSQIDHSDGGKYRRVDDQCRFSCYDNSVRRILPIQNALYTFSNKYLKVNSLGDFQPLQIIKLTADTEADSEIESPLNNSAVPDRAGDSASQENLESDILPLGPSLPSVPAESSNSSSNGETAADLGVIADNGASSAASAEQASSTSDGILEP